MSIYVNGNLLNVGAIKFGGVRPSKIFVNGLQAWEEKSAPGSQTFTVGGTFTVPNGYYFVDICLCGGGGGGAKWGDLTTEFNDGDAGGGHAGAITSQTISVLPGEQIAIVIGTGGAGTADSQSPGNAGTASSFGAYASASGGAGGIIAGRGLSTYEGNGGSSVSCGGTFNDGAALIDAGLVPNTTISAFGGEAGAFGDGGSYSLSGPTNGGIGAGGGTLVNPVVSTFSGSGGDGQCSISWS